MRAIVTGSVMNSGSTPDRRDSGYVVNPGTLRREEFRMHNDMLRIVGLPALPRSIVGIEH